MSVIIDALKGEGGLMLYYLSLLTHTDQLAFFRLFGYLTFRSGAAVMTALVIAFLINPHADPLAQGEAGQGPAHPRRRAAAPHPRKGGHAHHGRAADPDPLGGSTLLWASLSNRYVWIVLLVTVAYRPAGLPGRLLQGDQAHRGRAVGPRAPCDRIRRRLPRHLADHAVGDAGAVRGAGDSLHQDGAAAAGPVLHPGRRLSSSPAPPMR